MKVSRLYVETSVIGGCFDQEFAPWSNSLMQDFRRGLFLPILSDVTAAEVESAPENVRRLHTELLSISSEVMSVDAEALDLLSAYQARSVLGNRFRIDMLHVALATIAEVDVLVSWNYRHLLRLDRIRLFNAVNLELGYKPLAIHSPREVSTYETE